MEIDTLKQLWQAQPLNGALHRSNEETVMMIKKRAEAFEKNIYRRDLRETLAAVVGFVFFGAMLFVVSSTMARIGCGVVMASAVITSMTLHRARRRHARTCGLPVSDFLGNELARVEDQIRLLNTVPWWYVLPVLIGCNLFVAGVSHPGAFTYVYLGVSLALGVVIWALNRRAVRTQLVPLREEIQAQLAELS